MEGTFIALRPFQYGPKFPEHMLDMHQVFEMKNETNDEALLRLKFAAPLPPKSRLSECGRCGAKFTDEFGLNRHGRIRHTVPRGPKIVDDVLPPIDLDDPNALLERALRLQRDLKNMIPADGVMAPNPEAEVDAEVAREEKLVDEMHPIAWDKTAAAVKADDVKVPEVTTSPAPAAPSGRRGRA